MTWPFNNIATQNAYVEATTARFPIGRQAFSLQVTGAGVIYKLIRFIPPFTYYEDDTEHQLQPVFANFTNPVKEGLQPGELFGGIMLRSASTGISARVTVI